MENAIVDRSRSVSISAAAAGMTVKAKTGNAPTARVATEITTAVARFTGTQVLDIAAGAGGQSLAAARRRASVVATDIAPAILEFAATEARTAGFEIKTLAVDGEALNVDPDSFDAVISRLGYMYFPDKARALRSAARALRPGGRIAAIGFTAPDRNAFFSIPIGIRWPAPVVEPRRCHALGLYCSR